LGKSIETRIALRGDIKDVMKKMNSYQKGVHNINNKVNKSFKNTNAVVGKLGGLLAGIGVGIGFKKIIETSGQFENMMSRVSVITQTTGEDFESLRNLAKDLGSTTAYSASEAAEGITFLGQAGYNTDQIISALPHTLNLASAGAIELGQAADIASNVVAGMGYDISQTERVIDVLAHTSRTANTNVTEMGDAAVKAAPVFAGLGLEVEELAVSAAIMANNGIKGADAGTAMAGALSRLLKQPKMVSAALSQLGVTITEQSLKTDGFIGTLQKLSAAGITNTQMASIFGDHWKSIGTIINTSSADINALTANINNSNGAAKDMAKNGMGAWQRGMAELNSAIEGLMINLGEGGLLGTITKFVNNLTSFISSIGQMTGSFENAIPIIYAFAAAATAAWAALTGGLSAIVTAVAVAVTGIITYWNDIILAIENSINAVIDLINEVTVIRTAFVMAAEYFKLFYETGKTYLGLLVEYFKTLGTIIYKVLEVAWNKIKSLFNDDDYSFVDNITNEFKTAFDNIKNKATESAKHLKEEFTKSIKNVADTWNGKEIAHVKIGLTTSKAGNHKSESKSGDVGKVSKAQVVNKPIESFDVDYEFEEIPEQLEIIDSAVVNVNDSLASLGQSFTSVFGGASKSLGAFVGNALSSLPKLMDNLKQLGIVQRKEALKEVAGNQAKAISGGTASAAKLAFPANLAAIAAVIATVTSVFSSLPKFETGGVVGGSSYYGDKILARVNSGEVILNRQQQAKAYNMMGNSGGYISVGEARLKGGDIVYALNYHEKNNMRNG
jgi:TP901 family phage tail tape measure protein